MIYHFSLSTLAIVLGLFYTVSHLFTAICPKKVTPWLTSFCRNKTAGYLLMGLASFWIVGLCATMDLGEFTPMRQPITLFFASLSILSLWLLTDYSSVRGMGCLLLLGANVLLDGAFLNDSPFRLVVVTLAYVWVILGIIIVCSPYRLRDGLQWVVTRQARLVALSWAGALFGVVLVILGVFVF